MLVGNLIQQILFPWVNKYGEEKHAAEFILSEKTSFNS